MAQDLVPASWEDVVTAAAKANGVNPALAIAVAKKESSLNPDATGDGGKALGMFQLHQGAATDTGVDRMDPIQNITGGVKYLRQLTTKYNGDVNKALMAYNGGMEGVDAGTPSPQAQAYASDVLANLSSSVRPPAKPTFTDESVPIKPTAPQPSAMDRVKATFNASPEGQILEGAKGAAKKAGETVTRLGSMVRQRFPQLAVGPEVTFSTTPTNTAQKVGGALEQMGEFALPAGEISKGAEAAGIAEKLAAKGLPALAAKFGAAAAEGVAQGASAFGVSRVQGATNEGAGVNAALSTVAPIATKALELGAPALRAAATTKLARVFARGVENAGPEIQYGLKTGEMASDVKDAANIVRQAASDTINLPLQSSWGKWMATNGKNVDVAKRGLGQAIKGDLGNEMLYKKPLIDALDKLEQDSAKHFAEISGGLTEKVYNEPLFKQIKILKDALNASGESATGYGDMISVRNLSDLKQTWDDVVYGLSTVGKVGVSPEVLTASAQKEATKKVADSVRALFAEKTPTIAKLNQIASHAYRLEDLTKKLYKVSPGLGKTATTVLHVAGAGAGAAVGEELGGHTLYGIMAGGALARSLESALNSPLWQTASPIVKGKIANALAAGDADTVRKLIVPFVSSQQSQPSPTP